MAINMSHINGVQVSADLVTNYIEIDVVILSINDDESYVTHALKTGAKGYLLKEMDSDSLIEAIKVVSTGGSYLHPKITHNLVQEYRRLSRNSSRKTRVQRGIKYKKTLHILNIHE